MKKLFLLLVTLSLTWIIWQKVFTPAFANLLLVSVLLHELGHLVTLYLFGGKGHLTFIVVGAFVRVTILPKIPQLSRPIIAAAGLAINYLLTVFELPINTREAEMFKAINFMLFATNAIPIVLPGIKTDGGHLMESFSRPIANKLSKAFKINQELVDAFGGYLLFPLFILVEGVVVKSLIPFLDLDYLLEVAHILSFKNP